MLRHQFMAPVGRENRAILLCEGVEEWGVGGGYSQLNKK